MTIDYVHPGADESWGDELHHMREDLQRDDTRRLPAITSSAHPLEYDEDVERQRRYIAFLSSLGSLAAFAETMSTKIGGKYPALEGYIGDIMEFVRRDLPRMEFKTTTRRRGK